MIQVNKARPVAQQIDEQLKELQQASHTSIQQLEAKIKAEKAQLQERRVVTFEAGWYTDDVRYCCLELNVGVNNVDQIICSVLTNIAGNLPRYRPKRLTK